MADQFSHGYALLVGVGECRDVQLSLPATANDVVALERALLDPNICAYPSDKNHVRLLKDKEATTEAILAGLKWLKIQCEKDVEATALVYFSGHGYEPLTHEHYYLVTHRTESINIENSALPAYQFIEAVNQIPAKRLLTVIDACHAGGIASGKAPSPANAKWKSSAPRKELLEMLSTGRGKAVLSSSSDSQRSCIHANDTISIFTYHFLEALQGARSKPKDHVVLISDLMSHLTTTVPKTAHAMRNVDQIPCYFLDGESFPIALLLGGKGLPAGGWADTKDQATKTIDHIVQNLGVRNITLGDNAQGNTLNTGDDRSTQQGKYNTKIGSAGSVHIGDEVPETMRTAKSSPSPAHVKTTNALQLSSENTTLIACLRVLTDGLGLDAAMHSEVEVQISGLERQLAGKSIPKIVETQIANIRHYIQDAPNAKVLMLVMESVLKAIEQNVAV